MPNDERIYYVICGDRCLFEGMTKEQIYAAIADATGNVPTGIDDAFITKIKEQNHNATLKIWYGTEAEYNALATHASDTLYLRGTDKITDLKAFSDAEKAALASGITAEKVAMINEVDYAKLIFGTEATVTIPNGVTEINNGSLFFGNKKITSLDINSVVKLAGAKAFNGLSNLVTLNLQSLQRIEDDCGFQNCTSIALTSLPNTLVYIGANAFNGCTALALTSLPSALATVGASAFNGCTALALTSLPNTWTVINDSAFKGCSALALTSLPSGVTNIGESAFKGCSALALTSLPSGVTNIGGNAFNGCTLLAIDLIPSTVLETGYYTFKDCTSIENMEIACLYLQGATFQNCSALTKVWIRSSCITISASSPSYAPFGGCAGNLTIYVEGSSAPAGWETYWKRTGANGSITATVVYGQTTKPW